MIDVSYLQSIYPNKMGERVLHRSHITGYGTYDNWSAFADGFFEAAMLPTPATSKNDAYGWCATLFDPSGEEDEVNARNERFGGRNRHVLAHRKGEHADPHLTLFFADLDNHIEEYERISIDEVEQALRALALPHILYTSYSHKPERNKVRIIIPVDRPLTPKEAFEVFIPFNHALNYQLDGSVYDPGDFLYGPPLGSDIRICREGQPLKVDEWIALSATMSDEARNFVTRRDTNYKPTVATPEDRARAKARSESLDMLADISIHNPKYFNAKWFDEADQLYCGGSHWATMIGLLGKIWFKSRHDLSFADMSFMQDELDNYWVGYLRTTYNEAELRRAIKDVMKQVGASLPIETINPTDRDLQAAMSRIMKRKKRK